MLWFVAFQKKKNRPKQLDLYSKEWVVTEEADFALVPTALFITSSSLLHGFQSWLHCITLQWPGAGSTVWQGTQGQSNDQREEGRLGSLSGLWEPARAQHCASWLTSPRGCPGSGRGKLCAARSSTPPNWAAARRTWTGKEDSFVLHLVYRGV